MTGSPLTEKSEAIDVTMVTSCSISLFPEMHRANQVCIVLSGGTGQHTSMLMPHATVYNCAPAVYVHKYPIVSQICRSYGLGGIPSRFECFEQSVFYYEKGAEFVKAL